MITVYSKDNCNYCTAAIQLLEKRKYDYKLIKIGSDVSRDFILKAFPTMKTVPIVTRLIGEEVKLIGGYAELLNYLNVEANCG